jgi:hypothetical protein
MNDLRFNAAVEVGDTVEEIEVWEELELMGSVEVLS